MPNQHADAAGIDGGDFFEIQDDAILILAEEFDHSGIETIERRPMAKRPLSLMILTPSTVFVSMSKVLTP